MPQGKGTYGSKKGRPPAKDKKKVSKGLAALAKKRPKVAAAIMKNKKKKPTSDPRSPQDLFKPKKEIFYRQLELPLNKANRKLSHEVNEA